MGNFDFLFEDEDLDLTSDLEEEENDDEIIKETEVDDEEERDDVPEGLNCDAVIEESRKHIVPEFKVAQ